MSLAQIEEEISQFSREELVHLQQAVDAAIAKKKPAVTPEMLEERRRLSEKFMSGEWGVELAGLEADQAKEREKNEALHRRWRD